MSDPRDEDDDAALFRDAIGPVRKLPDSPPPPMPESIPAVESLPEWRVAQAAVEAAEGALALEGVEPVVDADAGQVGRHAQAHGDPGALRIRRPVPVDQHDARCLGQTRQRRDQCG